jgi:hypothetical protein
MNADTPPVLSAFIGVYRRPFVFFSPRQPPLRSNPPTLGPDLKAM